MASLTPDEFVRTVRCLSEDLGLQRLRDKLVRLNALVTRRRVASPEALADQLYMLTGGLRRQIPATIALQSLWAEHMNEQLGEEGEKALEEVAEKINACLDDRECIEPDKEQEMEQLLGEYQRQLAEKVGPERARIDMLLKAVQSVAVKLRAMPLPDAAAAPTEPAEPQAEG